MTVSPLGMDERPPPSSAGAGMASKRPFAPSTMRTVTLPCAKDVRLGCLRSQDVDVAMDVLDTDATGLALVERTEHHRSGQPDEVGLTDDGRLLAWEYPRSPARQRRVAGAASTSAPALASDGRQGRDNRLRDALNGKARDGEAGQPDHHQHAAAGRRQRSARTSMLRADHGRHDAGARHRRATIPKSRSTSRRVRRRQGRQGSAPRSRGVGAGSRERVHQPRFPL